MELRCVLGGVKKVDASDEGARHLCRFGVGGSRVFREGGRGGLVDGEAA